MSDFDLRPHVNTPPSPPDYRTGDRNVGLWLLVAAIAIGGLLTLMFFADAGSDLGAIEQTPIVAPASLEVAPESAPQPLPTGE